MAIIYEPVEEAELRKMTPAVLRKEYERMTSPIKKIMAKKIFYCHACDDFHSADSFYQDKRFKSGVFPECKKTLLDQATDYNSKTKTRTDNKDKCKEVFRKLNLPFYDYLYRSCLQNCADDVGERNFETAYQHMLIMVKTLTQYRGKTWKDSEFDEEEIAQEQEEINENSRILKTAKKRFGKDYFPSDLIWLETEYQDWIKRYPCENKSQEVLYKNLCFNQLNIEKAQKEGKDTKDMLKTQQDIMASLGIKPSQTNSNNLTEAKTFGQLIEKWEDEWDGGNPIPEPDPDFKDVDKVGLYIDVFFKGHLAKMMNLKNGFTHLYEKFMSKYTVNKPQYDEDAGSEAIFDQLFGSEGKDL